MRHFIRENRDWLVILLVALAVAFGSIYAVLYRHDEVIRITARQWVYDSWITYTTTRVVIENVCDAKNNCSPRVRTVTDTHTRCSVRNIGDTLPPVAGELPCAMQRGDSLSEAVTYHVAFELNGEKYSREFNGKMWDDLPPNSTRYVRMGLFGYIHGLGEE